MATLTLTETATLPTLVRVQNEFARFFGGAPECLVAAPGRVNLIGEHTDYNEGFVLPAAINYHIAVAARRLVGRDVIVLAADEKHEIAKFKLDELISPSRNQPWSNYLRGAVRELKHRNYDLCGAEIAIAGDIPPGAGLSSSAALEIAVVAALTQLSNESIDGLTAALVSQAAENNFFGCHCGVMDPLVSALGHPGQALLLDCRTLQTQAVSLPRDIGLLVIHSGVARGLANSEYNLRRSQCEAVSQFFAAPSLRDVTLSQLLDAQLLLDPVNFRRAHHVITENKRVLVTAKALQNGDMKTVGELMAGSHASMRDDFEITVAPIDYLVELVQSVIGDQGGVRMTGGGFGGCVVALLPRGLIKEVEATVKAAYPRKTKCSPLFIECEIVAGVYYK